MLLICLFRDNNLTFLCLRISQVMMLVKYFFSKIGGIVDMERAYKFHELLATTHTMNHLSVVEFGNKWVAF